MKKRKTNMITTIKNNFSVIKDIGMILGMCGILYLNANYVTVQKYEAYQKANDLAHREIQTALVSTDKTLALMQQTLSLTTLQGEEIKRNTVKVAEIEIRLRAVETAAKLVK